LLFTGVLRDPRVGRLFSSLDKQAIATIGIDDPAGSPARHQRQTGQQLFCHLCPVLLDRRGNCRSLK
jgi:hypothetical protein